MGRNGLTQLLRYTRLDNFVSNVKHWKMSAVLERFWEGFGEGLGSFLGPFGRHNGNSEIHDK